MITGAAGEIGDALIRSLAQQGEEHIVTLDLRPLSIENSKLVTHVQGDLMDHALLARLVSEYEIGTIYHLAALLSTRAEFTPEMAHQVNVEGYIGLYSNWLLNNRNGAVSRSYLCSPARLLPTECLTWK